MTARALIVDDEADIRALLEITLSRMGLETQAAANLSEAREALKDGQYNLCLTDMRLPDGLGIDLVQDIQTSHPHLPIAVITAYGNAEDAVNSLKAGAFDFVTKPVDIHTLRRLVNSALSSNESPKKASGSATEPLQPQLTGDTSVIQDLRRMIAKLSRNQAPVHICGESGTGKELVATMIHAQGSRASKPFVPVNCGAVPTELMESEFFGHTKGSFTGAVSDRPGLFRSAEGGTLFLDEVGDLPLHMQVKLLRAIQERKIRPVGHSQEISVDVRIISATHRNLQQLVAEGKFREDLYYRLNVIEIDVPALRERRDDIPALAQTLLHRISERHGLPPMRLSKDAQNALVAHDYPGNIRELENILERAAALAEDESIEAHDLRLQPSSLAPHADERTIPTHPKTSSTNIDDSLAEAEKARILDALERARFNKTRAAELLGISFRSLRYRLKKLDIK